MNINIRRAHATECPDVLSLVGALLGELGEELGDCPAFDEALLRSTWEQLGDRHAVFVAEVHGEVVGLATALESFAFYANGLHGVINEMFVSPDCRSHDIGTAFVDEIVAYGRGRGWSRLDVTAPESQRWERTRGFYMKRGFTFAGPKFKLMLATE